MLNGGAIMENVVFRVLIKWLIVFASIIIYLHCLIKRQRIIKWEDAPPDMRKLIKNHEKKINTGLKILIGSALLWMSVYFMIPAGLDFFCVLHGEYDVVRGKVVSWDYSDEEEEKERTVTILSADTGEEIGVIVYSVGIRKGDYLEVRYLPHTGYGEIISLKQERIEKDG